jgi:Superinfection immunity protein
MDTFGTIFASLLGLATILFVYFLPALVARERTHHQVLAIFMLNLLLGWTLLGWVGALIWACTKPAETSHMVAPPRHAYGA